MISECVTIDSARGPVAQWTRARGYGPRCRGFESLLARSQQKQSKGHGFGHVPLILGVDVFTDTLHKLLDI